MAIGPNGADAEDVARWTEDLVRRSNERWGRDRTQANRDVIERTARAVATVLGLDFLSHEAPGFFLSDSTPEAGE